MNKILHTLIVVITVSLCIFIPKNMNSSGNKIQFITKTITETVTEISLLRNGDSYPVILNKNKSDWLMSIDSVVTYPARTVFINEMLNEFAKPRIVFDTFSTETTPYGFDDNQTLVISIDKKFTLYFGNWSADGTDIYFRQNGLPGIYRTRDTFSQYLDTRTAIWAETEIWKFLSEKKLQRAIYRTQDKVAVITENPELDSLLQTLVYTRCLDITNIPGNKEEQVRMEFGDLSSLEYALSPLEKGYFSITNTSDSSSYVISQSTAEKIREPFRRFLQ